MHLVVESGVTFLLTVPVLGREYFASKHAAAASSLRTVIFCGEPLPKELVELVARVVSGTSDCHGPGLGHGYAWLSMPSRPASLL